MWRAAMSTFLISLSLTTGWMTRENGKNLEFKKIVANITNSEGEFLPGTIFFRGASVGMLVLLQPDGLSACSQEEKHVKHGFPERKHYKWYYTLSEQILPGWFSPLKVYFRG